MRFVDLFAGLGGFHLALKNLECECVFASEIDEALRDIYEKNFNLMPSGDIRDVEVSTIPEHDVLCAGFPCQPFSKAGDQKGFECPQWGNLFDNVIAILRFHRPSFFMLENVANLKRHNSGQTWRDMRSHLEALGYEVREQKLSPHKFGIPQIRERMFIVGSQSGLEHFQWPDERSFDVKSIHSVLDENPSEARSIPEQVRENLEAWQQFLDMYPADEQLPSFPIWTMEFGATYPYEETTPFAMSHMELQHFRGSHGIPLAGIGRSEIMKLLPSHARREQRKFPLWKVKYIRQNRELYARNRSWLDKWLPSIKRFPSSFQKLEWNCKGEPRSIWNFIIQIRASGVRVKRPNASPSLVAMTSTQIPIIAWENRYITVTECARLQSMQDLHHLPHTQMQQIRALGNAVNVSVAGHIAKSLIGNFLPDVRHSPSHLSAVEFSNL